MQRLVMSENEIQETCKYLGAKISKDLANETKPPLILCVLKGAVNFTVDLSKNITIPVFMDYIQISSYSGRKSTGDIKLIHNLRFDIKDRVVLICEDVIDTGVSMDYLIHHLYANYQPKKVLVCAMFDKINARKANVRVDYAGKILTENDFLIGYGLDYNEFDRNIPYVYIPTEEEIAHFDELSEK